MLFKYEYMTGVPILPLNKTEQEYFSRKVKKKLEAMTNKDVMKVAKALTKK